MMQRGRQVQASVLQIIPRLMFTAVYWIETYLKRLRIQRLLLDQLHLLTTFLIIHWLLQKLVWQSIT